ncbi:MAG: HAMP domain-containing protein [Bryobacterales bacterium]|nr:HAMP domain-containing protein [Bryobacterales bacterium]
MNRLRNRLILVFVLATFFPLCLTLWTTLNLLELSRGLFNSPLAQLDEVSKSLETTGQKLYQQAREAVRRDAAERRVTPRRLTPAQAQTFWDSGAPEQFEFSGQGGNMLDYYVRGKDEVLVYSRPLGLPMSALTRQYADARKAVEESSTRDLRKGFSATLVVVVASLWLAALIALVYVAHRISRPVHTLTEGLGRVAAGDLSVRVAEGGSDEIGEAVEAFNHMAAQLEQARERLIHLTRLATWQSVARKMAHELKNSLTPIRLTTEEIASRAGAADPAFLEQASQIVAEEVNTLERRVRAFSEFASEPPVIPAEIDVNAIVEERVCLLKAAHPEVAYELRLLPQLPKAVADADLIKGVLTNLLENAAEAVKAGGVVMAKTGLTGEKLRVEIHDSGPGLSAQARSSLFEPAISFKKGGMGLGLSIARRSALLCGGDLEALQGELGGAAFRLTLAVANGANGKLQ